MAMRKSGVDNIIPPSDGTDTSEDEQILTPVQCLSFAISE